MKVRELIEKLQEFDQELEVFVDERDMVTAADLITIKNRDLINLSADRYYW